MSNADESAPNALSELPALGGFPQDWGNAARSGFASAAARGSHATGAASGVDSRELQLRRRLLATPEGGFAAAKHALGPGGEGPVSRGNSMDVGHLSGCASLDFGPLSAQSSMLSARSGSMGDQQYLPRRLTGGYPSSILRSHQAGAAAIPPTRVIRS